MVPGLPDHPSPSPRMGTPLARAVNHLLYSDAFLVLLAFLVAMTGFAFNRRILHNDGLGFDGVRYAKWARAFPDEVFTGKGMNTYSTVRLLPSAVVHYSMRLTGVEMTNRNVVRAFGLLHVVLITLAARCWVLTARELGLGVGARWFGFAALFLNFVVVRMASYYPVLTDVPAYAVSAAILLGYLKRWNVFLAAVTLAAGFTFPPAFLVGIILLLFPRETETTPTQSAPWRLHLLLPLMAVSLEMWLAWPILTGTAPPKVLFVPPMTSLVWFSFAIVAAYLFLGLAFLLNSDRLFDVKTILRRLICWQTLFVIALFACREVAYRSISTYQGLASSLVLQRITMAGMVYPGVSLIAHTVYFGPVILVALWLWRPVCGVIHRQGVGLTLVTVLAVCMGMFSESRCLVNFLPLLVPFVALAVQEQLAWRPVVYVGFCAASLALTRPWVNLNENFPRRYLENFGPWMTRGDYFTFATITFVLLVALYPLCCWWRRCAAPVGDASRHLAADGPTALRKVG